MNTATRLLSTLMLVATTAIVAPKVAPQDPAPRIDLVIAAEHFNPSTLYWQQEVGRRYDDAVILFVHGNTGPDGQWWAYPSRDLSPPILMRHMVATVRLRHPGRHIVVVACNPGALRDLDHIRGVSYALENVWMIPERNSYFDFDEWDRAQGSTGAVGDIFDFVETF